jgi:hypothetical protein
VATEQVRPQRRAGDCGCDDAQDKPRILRPRRDVRRPPRSAGRKGGTIA